MSSPSEQALNETLALAKNPEWGAQMLKNVEIFSQFTHSELTALYQLGHLEKLKSGTHVVIEGEPTRGLYLILQGLLSVYKNNITTGNMARIASLEIGQWFGEYSLFDDTPRSATIRSETWSLLFSLPAQAFNNFLESHGDKLKIRFYETCAKNLVAKFRIQNAEFINAQDLLWRHALRKTEQEMGASAAVNTQKSGLTTLNSPRPNLKAVKEKDDAAS
ncbi:MAG: cyclic nucleotide-binding domain-containing protein [Oligoflexales bacterium]|nr:cyclic nucleotide-binding domain-containing protein [Oligoflexales bacterium]